MSNNNKAKLYHKILAVQKNLQPLGKSGRNDFHKYDYTTAVDVLLPVQKACNEQGLIVVADCVESHIETGRASVIVRLTVVDSETGETLDITCPGYAEDWSYRENKPTGDKALYKAITGATKYAVRSFFCLPSEDEPERMQPIKPAQNVPLLKQTDDELKRLGWGAARGKLYLQEKFGKSSRSQLTQQELQQFLQQLRAIPTPVISDTRTA